MTDGSINPANNQITITQGEQQEAYCQEITRCIEECGFKYTRSTRRRSSTETHYNAHGDLVTWTVSRGKPRGRDKDKTGWARLEPWLSKDMSPELAEMTERQFSVMLEAIFHGDGNKSNTITYDIGKGNRTSSSAFRQWLCSAGIAPAYPSRGQTRSARVTYITST